MAKFGLNEIEDECYTALIESVDDVLKELIEKSIDRTRIRNIENQPNFNRSMTGERQYLNLHTYRVSHDDQNYGRMGRHEDPLQITVPDKQNCPSLELICTDNVDK
jgi:hypothetical protein